MSYTKGKLHRHNLEIHIQRMESGKVVEHTCIANGNETNHLPDEANIEHLVTCWNNFDKLLEACNLVSRWLPSKPLSYDQKRIATVVRAAIAAAETT